MNATTNATMNATTNATTSPSANHTLTTGGLRARPTHRLLGRVVPSVALLLAAIALGSTACRRSHVAGTPSTDAVLEAFRDAKLAVEGVKDADADTWSADRCSAGHIAGLDVVICEYANEQMLAKTEADAVRDWNAVNVDTGIVTHNGHTLLMIVDRSKKDVNGRAIASMLAAFKQAR